MTIAIPPRIITKNATPPKTIWSNRAFSISVIETVQYSMISGRFVSATGYYIDLQTSDGDEYRFHIGIVHSTPDGRSRTQFAFLTPGHRAGMPDRSRLCVLKGNLSLIDCVTSGGLLPIDFSICESTFHNRFRLLYLNGMPSEQIFIITKELKEFLRTYGIPEPAISRFIEQTSKHLRLAIKAQTKRLAAPLAPSNRWPRDRRSDETPVDFVRRVYGELIDHGGMTQSDLATIDKKALEALRNYCGYRHAYPERPRSSDIVPPSKRNPDDARAKYGKLTYANSVAAWRTNPSRENLERKRAYEALLVRRSRARNHDPT